MPSSKINEFIKNEQGVFAVTEDGEEIVCTVSIEIDAIEIDEERNRKYYVARLGEPLNCEVRTLTKHGSAGLAKAVTAAGAWANAKLLIIYLDQLIAEKWQSLIENKRVLNGVEDSDPEALPVYEKFWEWVDSNIQQFDSGNWGTIEENERERKVTIWTSAFAKFFADVGIRDEEERKAVLKFWKKQEWLFPEDRNRYGKTRWDPAVKRVRYIYEIVLRNNENVAT